MVTLIEFTCGEVALDVTLTVTVSAGYAEAGANEGFPLDDRSAIVTLTRFDETVSARLLFDDDDQLVDFVSDDPAFVGTMTMTWSVQPSDIGTCVEFIAEHVPDGISAEDHAAGMASSLENLAAYLEGSTASGGTR